MIGSIVSTTIMSVGRVDIAMWTTVVGACVALPLFYVGSGYGIVGLSVAWLAITPILFMLNMFRALPTLGLSIRGVFTEMWRPMVVAAVMFVAVEGLRQRLTGLSDIAVFAMLVVAGSAIHVAGTWLLNRAAAIEALSLVFPGRFAHSRVAAPTAP